MFLPVSSQSVALGSLSSQRVIRENSSVLTFDSSRFTDTMADSWFSAIQVAPPIEVFNLSARFQQDGHADKVNLGVGGKVKLLT